MSIFDKAYDEMNWYQVCSRLPGELAVRALQRRILNLSTLSTFVDTAGSTVINIGDLKGHVNNVLANASLDDIFDTFDEAKHPILFQWLDDENTKRIKENARDKLTTKFKFNITESSDEEGLAEILDTVLTEDLQDVPSDFSTFMDPNCADCGAFGEPCDVHMPELSEQSSKRIRAVLEKADSSVFKTLVNKVLGDKRPTVRASVLGLFNYGNNCTLTDNQNLIALKAFVKLPDTSTLNAIRTLNYKLFSELRPMERLVALERYLNYFPRYRKIKLFEPMPTLDEFKYLLFSCSIEHHERVEALYQQFRDITELDPPVHDEEDDY